MLNAAVNVAVITLMFVWDRTVGHIIPLSVLDNAVGNQQEKGQLA